MNITKVHFVYLFKCLRYLTCWIHVNTQGSQLYIINQTKERRPRKINDKIRPSFNAFFKEDGMVAPTPASTDVCTQHDDQKCCNANSAFVKMTMQLHYYLNFTASPMTSCFSRPREKYFNDVDCYGGKFIIATINSWTFFTIFNFQEETAWT